MLRAAAGAVRTMKGEKTQWGAEPGVAGREGAAGPVPVGGPRGDETLGRVWVRAAEDAGRGTVRREAGCPRAHSLSPDNLPVSTSSRRSAGHVAQAAW